MVKQSLSSNSNVAFILMCGLSGIGDVFVFAVIRNRENIACVSSLGYIFKFIAVDFCLGCKYKPKRITKTTKAF